MPANIRFAFLDHPGLLAFAHRGGALENTENTHTAFDHAVALGYRYIETDVQLTRDGVVVVFHDDDLMRLMGRPERIDALDWADLAQLRFPCGARIPRLDETLEAYPDIRFNLEPKSESVVEPLAKVIRACDALSRVCVGCFDPKRTRRLRDLLGDDLCWSPSHAGVAAVWLAGWGLPIPAHAYPALQIPPSFHGIPVATRRLVRAAHARDIQVHVWTVDEADRMRALIDAGVDGLMTDRPTLLKQVLEARGLWV
ncbi:MAG: glycerophosphodiester phosphodiesterase [Salinarimonas sp.]